MVRRRWLLVLAMLVGCFRASAQFDAEPIIGDLPNLGFIESLSLTDVVLNGKQVEAENPFTTFTVRVLTNDRKGNHVAACTGIIVSKDLILTAGHCLKKKNMTAQILFGTGEDSNFTHLLTSTEYRSWFVHRREPRTPLKREKKREPKDPWLSYDRAQRTVFVQNARARRTWVSLTEQESPGEIDFLDFALIKVDSIPDGYQPVEFIKENPQFGEPVYIVGYGTNDRRQSKNTYSLRWSQQSLIGHYTLPGQATRGWQIFAQGSAMCLGDSGGPVLVKRGDQYKLLGMSVLVFNSCANSAWAMSPYAYTNLIETAAKALRSEFRL